MRRIDAFDIERRVGLGVAELLRLGKHGREREPARAHLGKDEVGRAVDDAGNPLDAVGREPFADRLDDRDAPGHGSLEGHHHAPCAGRGEDFAAMFGQQRLVRRHHVLSLGNRLKHKLARERVPTDEFDHDVNGRVSHDLVGIGGDGDIGPQQRAGLRDITHRNPGDLDATAGAALDFLGVAGQHLPRAAAHHAKAQQTNLDRFHHSNPSLRNISLMPRTAWRVRCSFSIRAKRT